LEIAAANKDLSNNINDNTIRIANNTSDLVTQGRDLIEGQQNLNSSIHDNTQAVYSVVDSVENGIDDIQNSIDTSNDYLNSIESSLNSDITIDIGSTNLPADNVYDPISGLEYEDSVEGGLSQVITDFIISGSPLSGVFSSSGATITNSSSILSFSLYGETIIVDFSNYESILQIAGVILYGVAVLCSFLILVA
jgi:hypothetical protein